MSNSGLQGGWTDLKNISQWLVRAGLSPIAAAEKAGLFAQTASSLQSNSDGGKSQMYYVPGRIEILGKHTDYAGGRSLIAAIERGFCLVASPRQDNVVHMLSVVDGREANFSITPELVPNATHWTNYPMTVARRIARNFPGPMRGADIAFISDLPLAAGMSSSSAMVIACFMVLSDINKLAEREEYQSNIKSIEELAGYLGTIENGRSFGSLPGDKGVGTFGGSEDHTAILCSQAGRLRQYSYCPVHLERSIELPTDLALAIGVSGVIAEKTGEAKEKYNRASRLVGTIVKLWNSATGRKDVYLADAVGSSPEAADRIRAILHGASSDAFTPVTLLNRFEHFLAESNRIIPAFGDAMISHDLDQLGKAADQSQELAERLLGNQVPETIFLAQSARECGAAAASSSGAGFGGSVWALVKKDEIESFLQRWAEQYQMAFPEPAGRSCFFQSYLGPAAFIHID